MNVLDHLLSSIDNGGRRKYLKRRCNYRIRVIPERRTNLDRRKLVDRRSVSNKPRVKGPERRDVI
jgi:hypothetical protein